MSRWFRHYAGMMRDDKPVRIAIKTKQPIERIYIDTITRIKCSIKNVLCHFKNEV